MRCVHHYVPVIVLWNYLQIDFKRHHLVARVGYCYQVSAVTVSVYVVSLMGYGKPLGGLQEYCCVLLLYFTSVQLC